MEYSNSQVREVIGEYIHNARDRKIMLRRMIDGITLERLAEEFDMSVSQMKRIIKRESDIVFRHIRE
jgi:AraC-like DNA-binding protein